MGKFKLRNGSGNATPFKLMADMDLVTDTEGGPGSPPGGDETEIKVNIDEGKFGLPTNESAEYGEFGKVGNDWDKSTKKNKSNNLDQLKMRITQSNFVGKHRKLGMFLDNTFYGTKRGKDSNRDSRYEHDTPWKRYRAAVKDFKQKEIREKTDPFSKERRLAKQDLRGKFDSTGRRLSAKNVYQQKYLVNRRRGKDGNTQRGFHNPHIPEFKNRVSFAEWRQNRRNQKEKNQNAVASNFREGGNIGQRFKRKCKNRGGGQSCGVKERRHYFKRR